VITGLLALAVAATWFGCIGFARLPTAYARLHCVPFVVIAAGLPVTLAGFLADGISSRALKILFLQLGMLLVGAALSHATGRAIALRAIDRQPL
jgi:multicomponent Na+:H+ antiporter subunit G